MSEVRRRELEDDTGEIVDRSEDGEMRHERRENDRREIILGYGIGCWSAKLVGKVLAVTTYASLYNRSVLVVTNGKKEIEILMILNSSLCHWRQLESSLIVCLE